MKLVKLLLNLCRVFHLDREVSPHLTTLIVNDGEYFLLANI